MLSLVHVKTLAEVFRPSTDVGERVLKVLSVINWLSYLSRVQVDTVTVALFHRRKVFENNNLGFLLLNVFEFNRLRNVLVKSSRHAS